MDIHYGVVKSNVWDSSSRIQTYRQWRDDLVLSLMSQEGLIDHCIDPDTGLVTKPTKEKDESPSALQKRINVFNAESAKAAKYVRDRVSSEVKDVLDIKWTRHQTFATRSALEGSL
ncbi:hypothetical protein SeLEV6574_g04195 [Synchytrium endobioticum]|uniref:Uncharacterized protein n=1 Tax=Synchytrium endobioticum TaxID=286115 RepID=A0A507D0V5_9FUNG|nr:hypothetical protein SeLEV6574_g04195 [Synchytrium endobioticum]